MILFSLFLMERIKSIVGQKIVIYNKDNKILILKRAMTSNGPWNWDLPGWWILLNEDAVSCLEREIVEETWLKNITWILPIHTAAKTFPDGSHSFFVWYVGMLEDDQNVIISHEHDEYLWIDPKNVDMYKLQEYRAETVRKSMNITPHIPLK